MLNISYVLTMQRLHLISILFVTGLAGLSISFALSITSTLNWTVRMSSDLEANFVAVERIQQYMKIPSEAPRITPSDESVATNWPMEGRIEFINVTLRYRPGLPLVLKGLNLLIPARSKVGVVGRTGNYHLGNLVLIPINLHHFTPCQLPLPRRGEVNVDDGITPDC